MTPSFKLLAPVLVALLSANAQSPDVLDLTQFGSGQPSGDRSAGSGSGSVEGRPAHVVLTSSGLRMRITSMDRDSYTDGEAFVTHIELLNESDRTVTLPWRPIAAEVSEAPGAPVIKALLTAEVELQAQRLVVSIATLFGSASNPNTIKVLKPGGRAEIIAPGNWNFVGRAAGELRRTTKSKNGRVSVRLAFLTPVNGASYEDVVSAPVKLELRAREK